MSHPLFAVSRFKNRNGVYSFRVEGSLNGVRIRRNFKTQEEAAAEKGTLEFKAMQAATTGLQSATTFLAADQLREAEAAFRRLQDGPRSLTFYLNYALANHREPKTQKLLPEAVAGYVAAKEHEHAQDLLPNHPLHRARCRLQ